MKTLIKNGKIVLPDCSGFVDADLLAEDGRIVAIGKDLTAENLLDAKGKYLLPGLIDVHCHGSLGCNFGGEEDNNKILRFSAQKGITTVLPTLGANSLEVIVQRIERILAYKDMRDDVACIGGLHLEGPFVSTQKRGAMVSITPPCSIENFNRLIDAGRGEVKIMTIAPERENAIDVIREGVKWGVRMSLGHTMATYDEAMAAIEAGACHATHTFNAMREYHHREPGVLGAVLTHPSVSCEAICDMIHLAPATVKLISLAKGLDKMVLISDSGLITGMPDGEYEYEGSIRVVKDGVSRQKSSGVIAGSCFTMADGARNLIKLGFSLADVARVGSLNPARVARLEDSLGTLEVGKCADVLVCDEAMNIEHIMLRGKWI